SRPLGRAESRRRKQSNLFASRFLVDRGVVLRKASMESHHNGCPHPDRYRLGARTALPNPKTAGDHMNESSVPLHENRIINGVLKTGVMVEPQVVKTALASDFAIVAPPERANSSDLWPCIWALAAVLERQFTGTVSIDCGLEQALSAPTPLG